MNAVTGWAFADEHPHSEVIELNAFDDHSVALSVCTQEEIEQLFHDDQPLTSEQVEMVCQARLAASGGASADLIDAMPSFMTEGNFCWGKPNSTFVDKLTDQSG